MKVILCGYNWAGCKALELLLDKKYEVFVYTHEHESHIASLTDYCKTRGINYTLEKIDSNNIPFQPDLIVSVYYRYIISEDVLKLSLHKPFNLHPSLLPNYRGASSLTWAMINGDEYAGYTYHYMTSEIDKGRILFQKKIKIYSYDTQLNLYERIMYESLSDFNAVLGLVLSGVAGRNQEEGGSYYKRGAPYNGIIDPKWDDAKISRFIRALKHSPYPYAQFGGEDITNLEDYFSKVK